MRLTSIRIGVACVSAALAVGGCASGGDSASDAPEAQVSGPAAAAETAPSDRPTSPPAGLAPASFLACSVFDGKTGQRLEWDEVVSRCAGAQVVMIGEEHDLTAAQMMAADLFAAIVERRPSAALSLEFFERDEQIHLDDYMAGITTEEQFKAAAGRRAGNYPDGHRAMVEAAREAGVPVIASNAPRRYVRIARVDGYDALGKLSDPQRETFVVPRRMPEGRYREEFIGMMSAMGAHGDAAGPQPSEEQRRSAAEAMFRSQSLWDSTMADAIATAMGDGRRPVVHVVGRFHSDNEGGTLQMLRRLRPSARVVTLSCQRGTFTSLQADARDRADIVVYADDVRTETQEEGDSAQGG